jgi:cell division GTPase FtsZ
MTDELQVPIQPSVETVAPTEAPLELPDIEAPPPESYVKAEPEVVDDQKKTAIAFGFIGVGQAGGKIANEFYKLGYRKVLAVNTAKNDFAGLSIPTKCQLVVGNGAGAGKNPAVGAQAVKGQREDILSLVRRSFGGKVEKIIVIASGGGGTGNGGCMEMIDIARDYLREIGLNPDRNVGALVALPKDSERGAPQIQAADLMEKLFQAASTNLAPLILVDNEQIAKQWPSASVSQVFELANKNVCGLFDIFNIIASRQSAYSSFDKADLCSVLEKGAVVFGTTTLKEISSSSAISDAIRQNLTKGLLVEGVNLATSQAGAGVFVGHSDILKQLPASYVDEAFKTLARVMGDGSGKVITVHQGMLETTKPSLFLYTICGGVALPEARLKKLRGK